LSPTADTQIHKADANTSDRLLQRLSHHLFLVNQPINHQLDWGSASVNYSSILFKVRFNRKIPKIISIFILKNTKIPENSSLRAIKKQAR
jgi:hypothetical protein